MSRKQVEQKMQPNKKKKEKRLCKCFRRPLIQYSQSHIAAFVMAKSKMPHGPRKSSSCINVFNYPQDRVINARTLTAGITVPL